MTIEHDAALALIETRAADGWSSGWAEWDDLCDAAGVNLPLGLGDTIERAARGQGGGSVALLRALASAGVRLVRVPLERARFMPPTSPYGVPLSDVLAEA